jgi:hypothetical protein
MTSDSRRFVALSHDGMTTVPAAWSLVAVFLGTLIATAALTAIHTFTDAARALAG